MKEINFDEWTREVKRLYSIPEGFRTRADILYDLGWSKLARCTATERLKKLIDMGYLEKLTVSRLTYFKKLGGTHSDTTNEKRTKKTKGRAHRNR